MRILHFANFDGNIGDEANHRGFYDNFRRYINPAAEFVPCDAREFFRSWQWRSFDDEFIEYVNTFDLFVIGGGCMLNACWDYSVTGTTINLTKKQFARIKPPIFYNAIGFDDIDGKHPEPLQRCLQYLQEMLENDNVAFSVRNDGTFRQMAGYFDDALMKQVFPVPDGGFFFAPQNHFLHRQENRRLLGICLSLDRFPSEEHISDFIVKFSRFLEDFLLAHADFDVIFVPHIFSDFSIVSRVVNNQPDWLRRRRIQVAPLLNMEYDGADTCFSAYLQCDLVLSMRFHGCVVPMANSVPVVGITVNKKHGMMFDEIGLPNQRVDADDNALAEKLTEKTTQCLQDCTGLKNHLADVKETMAKEIAAYYTYLKEWIARR